MHLRRRAVAFLLSLGFTVQAAQSPPPVPADGQQQQANSSPALLRIRVVEGEGAIHTAGARASQPIVIFVADESGRPVEGASVSLRLPDDGPSGAFTSGMRTEVALTGPDGRASIHGIQWARSTGAVQLRIAASKGEARAGIVSTQYVTDRSSRAASPTLPAGAPAKVDQPSRSKWVFLAALIGGAAAGGVAAAVRSGSSPSAPPAASQPSVSIGNPSISIGQP
jgi:hypothetical protein